MTKSDDRSTAFVHTRIVEKIILVFSDKSNIKYLIKIYYTTIHIFFDFFFFFKDY